MNDKIYFAGDHNAGLHPKVVNAIVRVNEGKTPSYREDQETKLMNNRFEQLLGREVKTLTFNTGTAANILAISLALKPFESVICPETAHINVYEAGGPSRFIGCAFIALPTNDGKLAISELERFLKKRTRENIYSQPKLVAITQPTEFGTLWSAEELQQLSRFCKRNNLLLFMDGARIAQAVDKLGVSLKAMTVDSGVDLFTWGGIKNGGLADVLVILNKSLTHDADYIYKQIGQDVAKSRFYSATVNALLEDDLWIRNARHANEMAKRLHSLIMSNPRVTIVLPVETNFIWSIIPEKMNQRLQERFIYYMESNDLAIEKYHNVPFFSRWITSWETTEEEVDAFAQAINGS